jgi:AcrR family transcriptional regulator
VIDGDMVAKPLDQPVELQCRLVVPVHAADRLVRPRFLSLSSDVVVTYYFPARDDLIWAVVGAVFTSVGEQVGTRLEDVPPGQFVATYVGAWVDYYRTYHREMIAIAEIWTSFRDANGRPHLDARTLGRERTLVETALTAGQAEGTLGEFSPRVVAVTLKAALDGLLAQLALEPDLDLDAYRDELIALFDRATRPSG